MFYPIDISLCTLFDDKYFIQQEFVQSFWYQDLSQKSSHTVYSMKALKQVAFVN